MDRETIFVWRSHQDKNMYSFGVSLGSRLGYMTCINVTDDGMGILFGDDFSKKIKKLTTNGKIVRVNINIDLEV